MTTDTPENEVSEQAAAHPYPEVDWFLSGLVESANTLGLEAGVTLQTRGGIISGTLVGGHTYFEGVATQVEQSGSHEFVGPLAEALKVQADRYRNPDPTTNTRQVAFVHLRGARHLDAAGNKTAVLDLWWRGRLSEVVGFHLGTF